MATTPESKVKAQLKAAFKKHFAPHQVYMFMPVQSGMGATTLDFLICIRGLFIAIETKANGKKMTPRQNEIAGQIWTAGGLWYLVDGKESAEAAALSIKHITSMGRHMP